MSFRVGQIVRLNSGGPDMTVSFVGEKKFQHGVNVLVVECTWFEKTSLKKEAFEPEMIHEVAESA